MSASTASEPVASEWHDPKEAFLERKGLRLCYEWRPGRSDRIPIVLIMGLGCQMTAWPPEFLQPLAASGRGLLRLDNRDMGRSDEVHPRAQTPVPLAFLRYRMGLPVDSDYRLEDMAADVLALMNHLDLPQVHLVGVSMGGMIAQILAAEHARRIRSLSLLMSSDNSPGLPRPKWRTLWAMNGGGVRGNDREAALKRGLNFWKQVSSPGYPTPEDAIIQRIHRAFSRNYRPAGVLRQMQAIMATGSLSIWTRHIQVPTQILQGAADPLVNPAAAHRLHRLIPHSSLEILPGWGHDLPAALCPSLARRVLRHAANADELAGVVVDE